ncbi:MAG: hypothetical protein ABI131_03315, partial [Nostocoides sp.]
MTSIATVVPDRTVQGRPSARLVPVGVLTPALALAAVVVAATGALLPWVTVLHGFQPIDGLRLGGGDLAGLAVVGAVALYAAHRHGFRSGRFIALGAGVLVVVGALLAVRNLAAYVSDPGPAALLVAPTAGPGPWVLAAGGALLVGAAVGRPLTGTRTPGLGLRLGVAGLTFVAG